MDLAGVPAQTKKPSEHGEGEFFLPKLISIIVIPKNEFTFLPGI